jgi:hypothetical protein
LKRFEQEDKSATMNPAVEVIDKIVQASSFEQSAISEDG